MTIRDLRHNGTYWTATVYAPDPPNGRTCQVDNRYGSWNVVDGTTRRDVQPHVAAALQARVRKEERRLAHQPG